MEQAWRIPFTYRGRIDLEITREQVVALAKSLPANTDLDDWLEESLYYWLDSLADDSDLLNNLTEMDYEVKDVVEQGIREVMEKQLSIPPQIPGQRTIDGDVVIWPDGTLASEVFDDEASS
jgi:hypothetical protein